MSDSSTPLGHEAALVEFSSLREEILARLGFQHTLLSIQLVSAGAVFSFALSDAERSTALLVLPLATYMILGRYVVQDFAMRDLGRYIREDLSSKAAGALGWEQWLRDHSKTYGLFKGFDPLFISFPGVAILALAGLLPYMVALGASFTSVMLWIGWAIGLLLAGASVRLVWIDRRHRILMEWGRKVERD
jgi:hypothetical protein